MQKPNILFVNTHYLPDYHFGGIVESGSKLLAALRKISPNIQLVCVSKNPENVKKNLKDGDLCAKSNFYHDWGISIGLIFTLWNKIKKADVIYINGVVTFPVTLAAIYALLLKKKFIVATRGSFEPWRVNYKKRKKHFYYKYIVLPLVNKCSKVHVTSDLEKDSVVQYGIKSEIIVIPNGINLAEYSDIRPKLKNENVFIFLFLSRISKVKGLDILVDAFNEFLIKYPNANAILQLVGPDNENYLPQLNIKNNPAIKYIGTAYGIEKKQLYINANVFVLPSYSENFGNVIAEALACGCPVITTTGTPWQVIDKINAGIYIEPTKDLLLNALIEIYQKTNTQLLEMGLNGRKYVYDNLDWDKIGVDLFENLRTLKL